MSKYGEQPEDKRIQTFRATMQELKHSEESGKTPTVHFVFNPSLEAHEFDPDFLGAREADLYAKLEAGTLGSNDIAGYRQELQETRGANMSSEELSAKRIFLAFLGNKVLPPSPRKEQEGRLSQFHDEMRHNAALMFLPGFSAEELTLEDMKIYEKAAEGSLQQGEWLAYDNEVYQSEKARGVIASSRLMFRQWLRGQFKTIEKFSAQEAI